MATEQKRLRQLYEAGLNFGMREVDAEFYANDVLRRELEVKQPGCDGECGFDAGRRSGYCFDCPQR